MSALYVVCDWIKCADVLTESYTEAAVKSLKEEAIYFISRSDR